ncbi:MAG: DUF2807 domain-containing protein [Salinivirgaceae bacterium]|nr:DUF2807 domain-containing protein [Salinivirgaceae bacterium]
MRRILFIFLWVVVINSNANCQIEEKLDGFNKVEIFGKLQVRLEKSNCDSIIIQSGTYDVSKVKFEVEDGVLSARLLSEFPPSIKINITVKFQEINSLVVGGGAKIYNRGSIDSKTLTISAKSGCELDLLVNADSVIAKVNKGAFVRLTGENRYLKVKTATGGDFRSTGMTNINTDAILNGGTVEIQTAEILNAKVRYGGSLKYVEQPKKIIRREIFGGKIEKLEDF